MELLAKIQRELKVPKGQYNSFSKFHYRNAEDILEAVKPLLGDKGALILDDEIVLIGERYYVKAKAELSDDGKVIGTAIAYAREALDKKGMDEAQITGAASSYARKYALCGLFCIDDGKDADSDDNTLKGGSRHYTPEPVGKVKDSLDPPKPVPPKKIADQRTIQKQRIKELVDAIVLVEFTTADEYKKYVKENTGFELVEENYASIIDALEAQQH